MRSWKSVERPSIDSPDRSLKIFSTEAERVIDIPIKDRYQMYVCGITPYDATHLGHAATYLTFDIIHRYWLALGAQVNYIQNITDIDDPLLERAQRDGVDWKDLANSQIELFRNDMESLRILPPTHYEGAVEAIPEVISAISALDQKGAVYAIENDKYFEVHLDKFFGTESHLSKGEMLKIFAERGGDPYRDGKRDPLDALLWLAERSGEPSWPSKYGLGRPGWHIECAAIALKFADHTGEFIIDIQGGGKDLIFPHHEMSASQVRLLTGKPFASAYVHAGLLGLDGEKMSKSKGNLLFVSKLVEEGVHPMAIRWALLKRPYMNDYMWQGNEFDSAILELDQLRESLKSDGIAPTEPLISEIYDRLSDNLDTRGAIEAIIKWQKVRGSGGDAEKLADVLDSLLGISLAF